MLPGPLEVPTHSLASVCINMSEMFAPDLPFKSCPWVSASGGFPGQSLSGERLSLAVLMGKGPEPRLAGGWRFWGVDAGRVTRTMDGDRTQRARTSSESQGSGPSPPSSSRLLVDSLLSLGDSPSLMRSDTRPLANKEGAGPRLRAPRW